MSMLPAIADNAVLAAAVEPAAPNAAFVQSVTAVQGYSNVMAGLSLTGFGPVDSALGVAKTDAAQWYNSIYPTYLDMPATITSNASAIDSGLTTLVQLASQLQQSNDPGVRQAVNTEAGSLATTVQTIGTATGGLATALSIFANNLQVDLNNLGAAVGSAQGQVQALQQQLAAAYGQLQHLQNATCPSQSDINACQQVITSLNGQLSTAANAASTAGEAQQAASGAASGLQFLTGYWQAVTGDAQNCVTALTGMQSDPTAILSIDLANTQQLWSALEQQFQGISAQIST